VQNYPIQKKYQTLEFLRTIPHLRLRTPFNATLARFRSSCLSFINNYLSETDQKGGMFVQVQPPIITSSDCEGAGEVFTIVSNAAASRSTQPQEQSAIADPTPFFRTPKYLTVSSQLHLEAYAAELRNVWTLSPTFRAEKSDTPRHLAEFYMLEIEISYVTTLRALMGVTEHLIRSLVTNLYKPFHEELLQLIRASNDDTIEEKVKEIEHRWQAILGDRWITATYTYCMKQLVEASSANPKLFDRRPENGSGLQLEHERWVVENIGGGRPIFVTHYPRAIKPFYMAPSLLAKDYPRHPTYRPARFADERFDDTETGEDTVACFDLLMPFGACEIAGGSLREHRLQGLIQSMREDGMLKPRKTAQQSSSSNQANDVVSDVTNDDNDGDLYPFLEPGESLGSLKWYADLRRYGTMPHGGMGIGWDRLIAYLTGVHNLRDVVPFPRSFGKADC
jgi:asparaginyl-tRNA synthetase